MSIIVRKFTDLHIEDGWTVEDQVEDQIPEGDERHKVVELVRPVHCDTQHKRQEVHLEQNLNKKFLLSL